MSSDKDIIEQTRQKLDSVSSCMCLAKWLQLTLHLHNGTNHSCHHPHVHQTPLEELKNNPSALHNTIHKKEQRKLMLEGVRPPECSYCWKIEDTSAVNNSDRILKSADYWSRDLFDDVVNAPWDADINPSYLEVSFGNECNFACAYCAPDISSKIFAELKKEGPFPISMPFTEEFLAQTNRTPYARDEHNPYVEAFWKWFPHISHDLRVFRITGGEPLINKNTFSVMDHIIENPNDKMDFAINSNFNIPDTKFDEFLVKAKTIVDQSSCKNFLAFTSVDSCNEQAEYIRDGLDYKKFFANVWKYLSYSEKFNLTFMVTFNLMSVANFKGFLSDIINLKVNLDKRGSLKDNDFKIVVDISILHGPNYLSLGTLPKSFAPKLRESLEFMKENSRDIIGRVGFSSIEIGKMNRLCDWFDEIQMDEAELKQCHSDFYLFVNEYDKRRGKSFLKTFPEYLGFYKLCEDKQV